MPERHREHFLKVLRRRSSWPALVSDGSGRLCRAEVADNVLTLMDEPESSVAASARLPRRVTLVQAWIKPKSLSLVLQKAAELGAASIYLVQTDRSHEVQEKESRIEAILENACMQAYNPVKPQINTGKLADWLQLPSEGSVYGDLAAETRLCDLKIPGADASFVNGPEGGFSEAELEQLQSRARGVLLSENVLRSETAAIIALGYLCLQQ